MRELQARQLVVQGYIIQNKDAQLRHAAKSLKTRGVCSQALKRDAFHMREHALDASGKT